MHKVWNRCTRYENCAQGIKQLHKGMKCFFKVWNKCFLEKQWFFIPLWVCFIPFWVWKYRLFFPDDLGTWHELKLVALAGYRDAGEGLHGGASAKVERGSRMREFSFIHDATPDAVARKNIPTQHTHTPIGRRALWQRRMCWCRRVAGEVVHKDGWWW